MPEPRSPSPARRPRTPESAPAPKEPESASAPPAARAMPPRTADGASPGAVANPLDARALELARRTPVVLWSEAAAALAWAAVSGGHVPASWMSALAAAWVAALLPALVGGLRLRALAPGADGAGRWLAWLGASAVARGALWGLATAASVHASADAPAAPLALVAVLAIGLPIAVGAHLPALAGSACALVLPPAAALLARGRVQDWVAAAALLACAGVVIAIGRARSALELERDALRARADALARRSGEDARARDEAIAREARAREAADGARAEKLRFLATASHDLRQPVHAIGLFVGALREEVHEGRARYLVDRLDRSMSGIDELFNRLLDMARLDAGTIEPQVSVFPLAPLMQTLETRFSPMAQQRGLRLRVRPAPSVHVRTDPALLIEMLMNLLSNALRYTLRGGVLVGVRRRGGRALIQVWDTGVGIAEKDRHAIFEEFVQVGGPARDRRQGLGLGLAIVRRLGGLLGCPVAVRSRPGRGSVFELSLPAASPAARVPASAQAADADALQGMLILVVDDELDILIGMEALLASWGCFVIVARSVDEARAHLIEAERFPDAVVTDHRLAGDSTSADVAGVVSELVPIRVPVVVLSADAGTSLDRMARERGWSLLSKPVSPQRLRSLLVELTRPAPTSA